MKQIIAILFFLLITAIGFGQSRKAMKFYKSGRFAQAIPYFEQAIQGDASSKYKMKLADCYRKTNQLPKAEKLYSEIVQRKHFSSKIMLYYGEVLMGQGKYDEAKTWYLKYAEKNPKNPIGQQKADACDYVKTIQPYFHQVTFNPIHFNSDADDSNPTMYQGKIYFSSDRKGGFNVLKKKSGWTGRDFMRIYSVQMGVDSILSQPKTLPNRINNLNKNNGKPSFSRKGDFYFTRNSSKTSKDGTYKLHIYHARLLPNGTWTKPKVLSFCQLSINYLHPAVSGDGKTLYFASNRGGGEGGMDLFVSHKTGSTWSIPANLGTPINTNDHEAFPYIHPSGRLFFSSKGHNGFGGFDVFVTEKDDNGFWRKPINLGQPINSSGDDIGFFVDSLVHDALFSSNRGGNNDDIYWCHVDTNRVNDMAIDSTQPEEIDTSGLTQKMTLAHQEYGIELLEGDTIFLVAPSYRTDEYEVPEFLGGQLDQLIPAMYLGDFKYDIYCFDGMPSNIFSQETLVTKRAEAIQEYLAKNHVSSDQIHIHGIVPNSSKKSLIFADEQKIVILVGSNAH